jgi:hypothetical protein
MDVVLIVLFYELHTFDLIVFCRNGIVWLRQQVAVLTAVCDIFWTGIPVRHN